ncbi:oxidoreductase [Enemella evansiae]|nr:oxidoreductase [Enemella evansiae]
MASRPAHRSGTRVGRLCPRHDPAGSRRRRLDVDPHRASRRAGAGRFRTSGVAAVGERAVTRSVVVTGAAHGIGAAVARRLSGAGARVHAVDAAGDPEIPAVVADPAAGGVLVVTGDVTDPALPAAVIERAGADGDLDGLVISAALQSGDTLTDFDPQHWQRVLEVNAVAAAAWAAEFARSCTPPAAIVLVSSIHAGVAGTGGAAYAASKAALTSLGRQLAVELGPLGIRANVVEPGFVAVQRNRHRWEPTEAYAERRRDNPLGRVAEADDVAAVVEFLLSDGARHVNGVALRVDGGQSAGIGPFGQE